VRRHGDRIRRWGAVALALATGACLVPAPTTGQVLAGPQPALVPVDTPVDHSDLPYVAPGDPRVLDVYEPPGPPSGPRPLIVYVHGGAWFAGSKNDIRCGGIPPCNPVTSLPALGEQIDRGYVLASIDYRRLVPPSGGAPSTNRHPVQVEDIKLAVKWLRANAATFGIDPDQVVLAGHSAGGHLAALAALSPGLWEPAGVAATQVDGFMVLNGPTDLESWAEWGDAPGAGRAEFIADTTEWLVGCHYDDAACTGPGAGYDQASPLHHASAGDPPGYLTCKDWDPYVPCDQLQLLHDELVTVQGNDQAAVFDRIACTGSRPVPCGPEAGDPVERHNPDFDLNLTALQNWLDQVTN
jgi:acetyl esterase/lipase